MFLAFFKIVNLSSLEPIIDINSNFYQEKMRGQKGTLLVHALGYVNSTKVIYRLALERKGVF